MRIKDINEKEKNIRTSFGRNIAKGFQATQKGGVLAPDALEKGIKKFFTDPGDDPETDNTSKDNKKGGAGTDDAMNTAKADAQKAGGDAKGALATMAAKRKYSKELKGYTNSKADSNPPQDARLVGKDGSLYHWSGNKWLVRNDINGRYETAPDQAAVKAGWIDAASKGKTTYIKNESRDENMSKEMNEKSKGLYHNVNKRKKAGTSRSKDHPKAPSPQDWKNAAKTAKENTNEGLADKADMAERDHEVQMARADLYKIAKYAIELHDMMKSVTEADGIEGWQQSKITKAADYIGSVYHALDYDLKFGEEANEASVNETVDMYKESIAKKLAEKLGR